MGEVKAQGEGAWYTRAYQKVRWGCARNDYIWKKEQSRGRAQYLVNWAVRNTPLPLLPTLVTGNNLALNMKPIVFFHALDINITKRGHWRQDPCASDLLIWKFVEV